MSSATAPSPAHPVRRLLDALGRYATAFMAAGVGAGLILPWLADLLRPLLVPLLLVPLTIALVRLDWSALVAYGRRPLLIGALAAWMLVASPLAMWAAVSALPLSPAIKAALVLMAAAPPIVSSAAISLFLGLDAALAVVVVVLSTALVPLTLPPLALALLGLELEIGLAAFMLRLATLVGIAFAAAFLVRRFVSAGWLARNGRVLDGLSVLNLILFAIAIMAGVTEVALDRPGFVAGTVAVSFAANLALQAAGAAVGWPLGRRAALTLALMTGNCNMGLVLVVLADKADFDVVVYFALAQIPMYTLPGLMTPLYRRWLGRG